MQRNILSTMHHACKNVVMILMWNKHVALNRTQPRKPKRKNKHPKRVSSFNALQLYFFLSPWHVSHVAPIITLIILAIPKVQSRISCFWKFVLQEVAHKGNPIISFSYRLKFNTNIYFLSYVLGIYDPNRNSEYHAIYICPKCQGNKARSRRRNTDLRT
jgi:hypothetical protein